MGLSSIILPRIQSFNEPKALILDIYSKEDKKIASRMATMVWVLLKNGDNWIWKNEKLDANELGIQTFYSWNDWFLAQNTQ